MPLLPGANRANNCVRRSTYRTFASQSSSGKVSVSSLSCSICAPSCDRSCQRQRQRCSHGMEARRTGGGRFSGNCGGGKRNGKRRSCHHGTAAPSAAFSCTGSDSLLRAPSPRRVAFVSMACIRPHDVAPWPPSVDSYQTHWPPDFRREDTGRAAKRVTSVHIK